MLTATTQRDSSAQKAPVKYFVTTQRTAIEEARQARVRQIATTQRYTTARPATSQPVKRKWVNINCQSPTVKRALLNFHVETSLSPSRSSLI
jgi:hypothetical protein